MDVTDPQSLRAYWPAEFVTVSWSSPQKGQFQTVRTAKGSLCSQSQRYSFFFGLFRHVSSAQSYIHERNSKRNRISDIPFHRLWQASDAGQLAFDGLRVVDNQNLLLVSNGADMIVLPISPQQRRELAPIARGTSLTISSKLLIQTPVRGLEH
jgi:hypothetical protein